MSEHKPCSTLRQGEPLKVGRVGKYMRLILVGLVLSIVIGSFLRGGSRSKALTYKDLPRATFYIDHMDMSPHYSIPVHIVDSLRYVIDYGRFETDAGGLASRLIERRFDGRFSIVIWAKEDALFEDVWRVMELGSTNAGFIMAVRDRDTPGRKNFTLPRLGRSWDEREHHIPCGNSLVMEPTTNRFVVVCEKDLLTFDQVACSIEELKIKLCRVKRFNKATAQILILASADCPYQKVIHVLEACEREDLRYRYLGLKPAIDTGKGNDKSDRAKGPLGT